MWNYSLISGSCMCFLLDIVIPSEGWILISWLKAFLRSLIPKVFSSLRTSLGMIYMKLEHPYKYIHPPQCDICTSFHRLVALASSPCSLYMRREPGDEVALVSSPDPSSTRVWERDYGCLCRNPISTISVYVSLLPTSGPFLLSFLIEVYS